MKSSVRFWLMIAVLGAATAGMAMLSHGEATPMAKSLKEFPKQVLNFNQIADIPMDKETLGGAQTFGLPDAGLLLAGSR